MNCLAAQSYFGGPKVFGRTDSMTSAPEKEFKPRADSALVKELAISLGPGKCEISFAQFHSTGLFGEFIYFAS